MWAAPLRPRVGEWPPLHLRVALRLELKTELAHCCPSFLEACTTASWSWGRVGYVSHLCRLGLYGQLGHGDLNNQFVPRRVMGIADASQVACGDMHTLLIRADGRVSAFGFAANGA